MWHSWGTSFSSYSLYIPSAFQYHVWLKMWQTTHFKLLNDIGCKLWFIWVQSTRFEEFLKVVIHKIQCAVQNTITVCLTRQIPVFNSDRLFIYSEIVTGHLVRCTKTKHCSFRNGSVVVSVAWQAQSCPTELIFFKIV